MKKTRFENKRVNSNLFVFISMLFVTCLLISNIMAFKLIKLGPIVITSGVLLFPITYIVNDLISEVYGFQKAKKLIWFGFLMNLLLVAYSQLAIILPYPQFFEGQEAFATVLGNTARVLLGSLSAYLVGSFVNSYIMSKLKVKTNGKYLAFRAIMSTLAGELLDSIIFVGIVFGGIYALPVIITMVLTQTIFKTVYEVIIFPVTKLTINKVKDYENLDVFDDNVSYNPFKLK